MEEKEVLGKSSIEIANQYVKDAMENTIEWVLTDKDGKIHIVYVHDIKYDPEFGICVDYSTLSKEDPKLVDSLVYECAEHLYKIEIQKIKNQKKGFLQWMKSFFHS